MKAANELCLLDAGIDLVAWKGGRLHVLTDTAAVPRHDLWLLDDASNRPLRTRSQRNIRRLEHASFFSLNSRFSNCTGYEKERTANPGFRAKAPASSERKNN